LIIMPVLILISTLLQEVVTNRRNIVTFATLLGLKRGTPPSLPYHQVQKPSNKRVWPKLKAIWQNLCAGIISSAISHSKFWSRWWNEEKFPSDLPKVNLPNVPAACLVPWQSANIKTKGRNDGTSLCNQTRWIHVSGQIQIHSNEAGLISQLKGKQTLWCNQHATIFDDHFP
jgi:hypothetical protein